MNKVVSMVVVAALASVGMVEAKPEVRTAPHPVMHPIAFPTDIEKEKPKFHGKRHGHKHHVRPHGKRCHKHAVKPEMKKHHHGKKMGHHPIRKPMINAPIVRPVRKARPAIKRVG